MPSVGVHPIYTKVTDVTSSGHEWRYDEVTTGWTEAVVHQVGTWIVCGCRYFHPILPSDVRWNHNRTRWTANTGSWQGMSFSPTVAKEREGQSHSTLSFTIGWQAISTFYCHWTETQWHTSLSLSLWATWKIHVGIFKV